MITAIAMQLPEKEKYFTGGLLRMASILALIRLIP